MAEYKGKKVRVTVVHDIDAYKRAAAALQESEERFRTLVEYAPLGFSIMKPDRTFEYFNPKFTETFGYTLEDIPNKAVWFEKAYPDEELPGWRSRHLGKGLAPQGSVGRGCVENLQGQMQGRPG